MHVSVEFELFDNSLQRQNLWYMGEKCDNKKWDLHWKHPFPRISRYKKRNDIKEVDITEFKSVPLTFVQLPCFFWYGGPLANNVQDSKLLQAHSPLYYVQWKFCASFKHHIIVFAACQSN
jgi:hypothetical protein